MSGETMVSGPAARLARLRERLKGDGFDGFLIPKADKHQGESAPACDERLAWATGFTGSAGLAILLGERTTLFVDGRYEIQGVDQTPREAVDVVPIRETAPEDWLAKTAPTGAVIGYDPWLHTKAQIERLSAAAERAGARLKPLRANPIDALWNDRPAPPAGAAWAHPEKYAGRSALEKRADLAATLIAEDLSAAVLTQPDSIAWLLNIRGSDLDTTPVLLAFALLGRDGGVRVFTDPEKLDAPLRETLGAAVSVEPWTAFDTALGGFKGARVAVEKATAPVAVAEILEAGGAEIVWRQDPTILPKAKKNAAEIAGARAAHRRDGAALSATLAWIDAQAASGAAVDELAVVAKLEEQRRRFGAAEGMPFLGSSFDAIAGFGPNGAIVHYRVDAASNRAIRGDGLLLIDSGGHYVDGTTDVTRTVAIGTPPQDARAAATLVLKGMIGVSTLAFPPKTTGRELDAFARIALWRQGLDFDHGTGHGVGSVLSVHEGPQSISRRGAASFEPGMITSNEPGYYRRDAFGIRIENLVLVQEAEKRAEPGYDQALLAGVAPERPMHRFETLTLAPIDKRLIEPGLLTREEVAWLEAYHARVLAEIGPLLDDAEREWLAGACDFGFAEIG